MRSSSPLSKLYKFSDDSALTDFSETAEQFEKQVLELCVWCKNNYLELNVSKTKEMIIESNYRRSKKCVVDMDDDSSELMCSMYSDDLILEDSSESEETLTYTKTHINKHRHTQTHTQINMNTHSQGNIYTNTNEEARMKIKYLSVSRCFSLKMIFNKQ